MDTRIAAAAAAVWVLGCNTAFAGTSFTQVTTVNGQRTAVTKTMTDGRNAKAEFVEISAESPFMQAGSYMLFSAGDIYLVNPAARTYTRFDPAMMAGVAQIMGQMEVSDISFEKVLDEPGETILGYPTRHYQFKSSWSMGMQGMPVKTELSMVEDIWAAPSLSLTQLANEVTSSMRSLPEPVRALIEAQGMRNVEGFPLKQVSVQSTKVNMGGLGGGIGARMAAGMAGGGGDSTTTVEVTEVAEVDAPAATFELPAGYEEQAMFQNAPAMPNRRR